MPRVQGNLALAPPRRGPPVPPAPPPRVPPPRVEAPPGSWRYEGVPRWRWVMPFAMLAAATLHALVFLGVGRHPPPRPKADDDNLPLIKIAMPDLKDLEEPERAPSDAPAPELDLSAYAPALPDTLRLPSPTDFVQELDYASLIPPPDLSAAKVFTIPGHIRHSESPGGNFGDILNLADLDRHPVPIIQTAPLFPFNLRKEVAEATVRVEFIVDTAGYVVNPVIIDSTHPGFNGPALEGVRKWKFRPGMKAGRKVNTRMQVPIVFRVVENK